jgi:two-component system response regulator AtoC
VWRKLKAHYWPGSITLLKVACYSLTDRYSPDSLFAEALHTGQGIWLPLDGSMALDDMDCFIIKAALELEDNNPTATARALRAIRETLRYRVRKYNVKMVN